MAIDLNIDLMFSVIWYMSILTQGIREYDINLIQLTDVGIIRQEYLGLKN